ncbi:MAG: hypothetical protein IJO10_01095 [Clostridia bacterium]|nr:hypothetical protein [Clostridia bacterium]
METYLPSAKKMVEADVAEYHYETDILPVMNAAADTEKQMRLHTSFLKVTESLAQKIKDALQVEIDADIVLYMGLCNGAGWATKIEEKPVVMLGMEKIIELDWMDEQSMIGLIYHELGHIWHKQLRISDEKLTTQKEKSLWQLYAEGVAMYAEALLTGRKHFFHQNKGDWLCWCDENRSRMFREYVRLVQAGESTRHFFGDWLNIEGRSDVGYYLGEELVLEALKTMPVEKVLNLSFDEIETLLLRLAA